MTGILHGVGVGPGDPELITLKAARAIESAALVAYLVNSAGHSQARTIARRWLTGQKELPIPMPFDCNRREALRAYAEAASRISDTLTGGGDVAVLCEGDPLFYGSFIHLHEQLRGVGPCVVIPGICSVHAAAGAARFPLGCGSDGIAVMPGTAGSDRLRAALQQFETVAIIKPGSHAKEIATLIDACGRADAAVYIEHATRENERIVTDIRSITAECGRYFSMFLVGRARGDGG